MYIKEVKIKNIRSISHFEMDFPKPAGWHVLIGDNGAGKSTIIRAIAATLIGPEEITAVLPVWEEWLKQDENEGSIVLEIERDTKLDGISQTRPPKIQAIKNLFELKRNGRIELKSNIFDKNMNPRNFNWGNNKGWFSVAYGPFRRFTGGNDKWNKVFYAALKAGAHLSVFGEDIALTEALDWLKELDRKRLKQNESQQMLVGMHEPEVKYVSESEQTFEAIKTFINTSGLLPHNAYFDSVNIEGDLIFRDGNGLPIKMIQMSDGYRSILSLTFELIRQLVGNYSANAVFKEIRKGKPTTMVIDLPGVVLIDEIDAHLHPTWQTRIGQWFTKYFPNIQFIVTTHSPLVCRACENGSIWRLAAPGSGNESGEITGTYKKRLIYGNVLDAYGTEVFGENVSISEESNDKMNRLTLLNNKSMEGETSDVEEQELSELKSFLTPIL